MARIGELLGPNQEVIHPQTSASVVYLEDGRSVEQVLSDDIDYGNVVFQESSYKFSSDVEDDFAKTVVIKGQTYQNILPEPSTHILSSNKEIFKVNEGLDPNVEIVDGISKSAILSGQTLVNLCNASNRSETLTSSSRIFYCKIPYTIKANSVYTFFAKISNSTTSGQINLQYAHPDGTYSYPKIMDASTNGVVNTNIVNAKDITNILIYISNVDTGQVTVSDVMIIEGDYTNVNVPYFKGMQSVKMPVVTTTGKNLWNGEYENGYISPTDGYIPQTTDVRTTKWIKCKPNTTYICNSTSRNRWVLKGVNGVETVVGGMIGNETPTVTTLSDTTHLRCYYKLDGHTVENIQIEEGSTATSYEPYKSNILSCQLAPLNQSMFEQGSFSESTPANTQSYEGIKLNSGGFYNNRIRTKGTYKVVKGATYSGQLNNGYCIFICYCKNGLYSAKDKGWIDETNFTFTVPNDCDEMFFALRKTDNSAITPSDYPLIGLKIHQEVVLRSLPNGVKDTLNLMTGEYVQRIGEIVLDGSEKWAKNSESNNELSMFHYNQLNGVNDGSFTNLMCDKLTVINKNYPYGIRKYANGKELVVTIPSPIASNVDDFKQWLSQNPITVQYQLATPVVKTIDLSSSGNWEKVVLDGSENWGVYQRNNSVNFTNTSSFQAEIPNANFSTDSLALFTNSHFKPYSFYSSDREGAFIKVNKIRLAINKNKLTTDNVEGFKQYLRQNPVTLWYQTDSPLNSTQVKQPIFFKDGHIIQSSGVENSLIPTLDYQSKTSNSYVMDLMKTNTKYTMKAKSASGTFTIDGTSYGAGTNGTFTTPSSMTNKLLVMSNKTNEEVMILEGDVVSKNIPYFKGIKSAFEDEGKIEVLSTSQNILDTSKIVQGDLLTNGIIGATGGSADSYCYTEEFIPCPNIKHPLYVHRTIDGVYSQSSCYIFFFNEDKKLLQPRTVSNTFIIPDGAEYLRIMVHKGNVDVSRVGIMVTNNESDRFNQSVGGLQNSTKIPLLSPLRSLPNGVCDEVIINREKKKATLIQRVGYVKYDNLDDNNFGDDGGKQYLYLSDWSKHMPNRKPSSSCSAITSHFAYYTDGSITSTTRGNYTDSSATVLCWCLSKLPDKIARMSFLRSLAKQDGVEVQYELKTPVITEVDLEGFPYIYKDGHIFLNSEIAPTVGIEYGINQGHRIAGQVETLQRHEQQFTKLERYFADLVHSDYNFALLRFSEKLHQQEGDV